MNYIIAVMPLIVGAILDSLIGDPYRLPHPVRLIGRLIMRLESFVRKKFSDKLFHGGIFLSAVVLILSSVLPLCILIVFYRINVLLGAAAESVMCFYLFAAKSLRSESIKVYKKISENDIPGARQAVSMIVGRDTDSLDENGIIRAAVETVAENTSDGVTAPMMYSALGGAPLGFFYKAANTLDSMIGYKDEKYREIGCFAAKLDDVLNYIPSRITAVVMIAVSCIVGLDGKNALRIWRRDRRKHASPNSAQCESVCAGALRIRLAGDAYYFGKLVKKEYIGDDLRTIENEDIRRSDRLMYGTSLVTLIICAVLRAVLYGGFFI